MEESELSYPSEGSVCFGEKRIQPILKQIAILLEFCHRIGLYFRDFRLRKFVFTDSEK
jgi:serine/threonine protein kinase